jgi:glycosyltransferase involved in cell wall biosynthesis
MNILLCKNRFAGPISGADEIVVSYATELKTAGSRTAVLLVQPPADDDPLAARLRAAEVPLYSLASSKFSASLAAGRKLALGAMRAFSPASKLLRTNSRRLVHDLLQRYHNAFCEHLTRLRPDLVHVITPDPGAVMLIRAAHSVGVPVVYQEVGTPFDPPGFEEVYERFVSVLPLCAGVAALSPRLAREMGRLLPQIRLPQVLPLITRDAAASGALESRPSNAPVRFGFAARLEHLKGPLQLVEGFRIAHRSQPSVELRIAGEGSQRQRLVLMLRRLGLEKKCHLAGAYLTLEERSRFMRDIDVFVLPSLTEGTPNAIVEAMAHAKPVIATHVGGIPDFVSEDVGIIVPPGDVEALGAAMTRLANDAALRRSMGRAAREKYRQLFSSAVVLPLLTDFYRRIIDGRRVTKNGGRQSAAPASRHPWSSGADIFATDMETTPEASPAGAFKA